MSGLPESGSRSALLRCRKSGISDTGPATHRLGESAGASAISPNEFAKCMAENIEQCTKVIKFAGIKPE